MNKIKHTLAELDSEHTPNGRFIRKHLRPPHRLARKHGVEAALVVGAVPGCPNLQYKRVLEYLSRYGIC